MSHRSSFRLLTLASLLVFTPAQLRLNAQGKASTARTLRCTFTLNTTSTWTKDGSPEGVVKRSSLVLRYESINTDEGTAEIKNGDVATGITVQVSAGSLHFIQSFRSGALYVTTVFDREIDGGTMRAVHSRHESYRIPLDGATSSPEQYVGYCEVVK